MIKLIVSLSLVALFLVYMSFKGPYKTLEKEFPATNEMIGKELQTKTMTIYSLRDGPLSFHNTATIKLSPEFIEIGSSLPIFNKIQIPLEKISGCNKSCFGNNNWDVNIILGTSGTEISFKGANEIVEWCWEKGLPVITGEDTRKWLYEGVALASYEDYKQVDRDEYERRLSSTCQGY